MFDTQTLQNLTQYLSLMEGPVALSVTPPIDMESSRTLHQFIGEVKNLSNGRITIQIEPHDRVPSFGISKPGESARIRFVGAPLGHELSSFILAVLQVSGRAPKVDTSTLDALKNHPFNSPQHFVSYISLSCHNCPDVVQGLNLFAMLNPLVSHTVVDGGCATDEVERLGILTVPSTHLNGNAWKHGRFDAQELATLFTTQQDLTPVETDVLVLGGGPAGVSAAIYTARKGLSVQVIAQRIGGQVADTLGIENLISQPYTEGPKLVDDMKSHLKSYPISTFEGSDAISFSKEENLFVATLSNGRKHLAKAVILATGAKWRTLNIPGEDTFKTKGVAFCPHCDGPLFKGKRVAVAGGGNSGVEAAIDLAGLAEKVFLFEFNDQLKADEVLQKKLRSLPNVEIITQAQVKEIFGQQKMEGLVYENRETKENHRIELAGIFIQIGLQPNTQIFQNTVEMNRYGEILINERNHTNVPGLFAAGDCSQTPFKQIITAMGSGATAGLSAFEFLSINK